MNDDDDRDPDARRAHAAHAIEGTWSGLVRLGATPVPIVLRIERTGGELAVNADFPQHRRTGVSLLAPSFDGGVLRFGTRNMGDFAGSMSGDGRTISGAFAHNDQRYPLTLQYGDAALSKPARPQTPTPPFNYAVETVYVDNAEAGCRLAGTLTIAGDRPLRAAAVLVSGSGAMDRDETIFGHKPFWVLADHLGRRGYAVLRLDDRGVGESTGDRSSITLADDARDVAAAVDHLRARGDLRNVPVGLIGHSVGGLTAVRVAAEFSEVAFVVTMGTPGVALGEAFADRECHALQTAGKDAGTVASHRAFTVALYRDLAGRLDGDPIDAAQITALAERCGATATAVVRDNAEWIARFNEPWFRSLARHEPRGWFEQLRVPLLAINGERDVQTRAAPNLAAIADALTNGAHPDFSVVELSGLNHLFQTCTTGAPYEYPAIEETFAPRALDAISDWLDARFPARTNRPAGVGARD